MHPDGVSRSFLRVVVVAFTVAAIAAIALTGWASGHLMVVAALGLLVGVVAIGLGTVGLLVYLGSTRDEALHRAGEPRRPVRDTRTPMGATPDSHVDLTVHDLPVGHPGRPRLARADALVPRRRPTAAEHDEHRRAA